MSQLAADVLSRGAASIVGLFLLVATTVSLMRTVVIPRSLRSVISDTVARIVNVTASGLARLLQGHDLGVRPSRRPSKALAHHPSVAHQDGAHRRIGAHLPQRLAGQGQGPLHVVHGDQSVLFGNS